MYHPTLFLRLHSTHFLIFLFSPVNFLSARDKSSARSWLQVLLLLQPHLRKVTEAVDAIVAGEGHPPKQFNFLPQTNLVWRHLFMPLVRCALCGPYFVENKFVWIWKLLSILGLFLRFCDKHNRISEYPGSRRENIQFRMNSFHFEGGFLEVHSSLECLEFSDIREKSLRFYFRPISAIIFLSQQQSQFLKRIVTVTSPVR